MREREEKAPGLACLPAASACTALGTGCSPARTERGGHVVVVQDPERKLNLEVTREQEPRQRQANEETDQE